eukprot:Polyplicarium_translucidae@DN4599_c0_g1_i1.p1
MKTTEPWAEDLRPLDEESCEEPPVPRWEAEVQDESQRFRVGLRRYAHQYSNTYFCRLAALKSAVTDAARRKWGTGVEVKERIKDMRAGQECVIAGTLYKEMHLKPSVLAEYMKELQLDAPVKSYVSNSDFLLLEDDSARVTIAKGGIEAGAVVSGLVVAIRGAQNAAGEFEVSAWTLPELPANGALPPPLQPAEDEPLVAFVAGLRVGHPMTDPLQLFMLRNFLTGAEGSSADRSLSRRIVRLVVVGNSASAATQEQERAQAMKEKPTLSPEDAWRTAQSTGNAAEVLNEMDAFFSALAAVLPVDIMPGEEDPTTFSIPQHPVHPALFAQGRRFANLRSVTNPVIFSIMGVRFAGMSGQGVKDVQNFSSLEAAGDALELIMRARCLAPTAPDTLP